MADNEILIRAARSSTAPAPPRSAPTSASAATRSSRSAPTCGRRRAPRSTRRARSSRPASSTRTATPTRRCSGTRTSIPTSCTASPRCSSGTAASRSTPSPTRPAATSPTSSPTSKTSRAISSTTRCRGRGPTTPATATSVNATGTGINLAGLVGHSMLRLVAMGPDAWTRAATDDESAAMAAILRDAMAEGAWGLSTSFLDVDQSGRPVPSARPRAPSSTRCSTCCRTPGRGVVEVVPDLLGPTAMDTLRDLGQRCGARGVPITWTGLHVRRLGAAPYAAVDRRRHRARRGGR